MARTPTYNYSNYSLEELYRVTQDIDRNNNPDAYAAAVKEIVRKQKQRDASANGKAMTADGGEGELHGNPAGMIGALIGAGGSIVWMNLYPHSTLFYGQNVDPIVVQVGMVLIGICVGALCGACAGIFLNDSRR